MIRRRQSTSTVTVLFIKVGKIDPVVELVCMFLAIRILNFDAILIFRCQTWQNLCLLKLLSPRERTLLLV